MLCLRYMKYVLGPGWLLFAACSSPQVAERPPAPPLVQTISATSPVRSLVTLTASVPMLDLTTAALVPSEPILASATATEAPITLPEVVPPTATSALQPLYMTAATRASQAPLVVTAVPPAKPTGKATPALAYVFPVQPSRLAHYGSCHHDYPASDIFAPAGTAYVAVIDGVVDYVSFKDQWDPATDDPALRGGLAVALIGDDGVRYYGSHFDKIAEGIVPGTRVKAGQRLAFIGNSGNARTTPAHVHFGISEPTTPDDWAVRRGRVDPFPYLNAWRQAKHLPPDLTRPGGGVC